MNYSSVNPLDDGKSELSQSHQTSYFSSAFKQAPPFFSQHSIQASDLESSASVSQISYDDQFPNAETAALTEEEKARRRKAEKDRKLKEF